MNIAEVCGLRWKRVNLSPDPIIVDGESIPGFHAAVREQWHQLLWVSVKSKKTPAKPAAAVHPR